MHDDHLLHLLKKKRGFFETILDLSEDELDLPVSDWIGRLEQKKILLSCVDEIDEQLKPFKQKVQHLSHEVHEELDTIRQVIHDILHLDTLNQEKRKQELRVDGE